MIGSQVGIHYNLVQQLIITVRTGFFSYSASHVVTHVPFLVMWEVLRHRPL